MTLADKTVEELRAELRKGSPHLDGTLMDRQAVFKVKTEHNEAWLTALLEASSDPARAKELWVTSFPRGNGSSGLQAARRRRFGASLVATGLLGRERLKQLEATYDR